MKTLPQGVQCYKRTPTFTEKSVPAGLLKEHTTKKGSWAKIVVVEGKLLYRILWPEVREYSLDTKTTGIVEPQVPHEVHPEGSVKFYVEFHRVPKE
jgi:tellurite resistance-related uncharacterized protein